MTTTRAPSPDAIVITSLGMQSSLGGAITACAAARASMSMARDLDDYDVVDEDGTEAPAKGHPVDSAAGFRGFAKLLSLGWGALEDLLARDDLRGLHPERTGIVLCLPDLGARRPANAPPLGWTAEDLCARLTELASLPIPESNWTGVTSGHAGVLHAVADAVAKLRAGRLERCLVGSVDSLLDPEALGWLLASGRLKTNDRPNGLSPGEAGVFFVLERFDQARRRDAVALATIAGVALGSEPHHALSEGPGSGEGLARVIDELYAATGPGSAWLLTDHNGESYRANELGMAMVRLAPKLPAISGARRWFPAASFGETGAASAALAVGLAARAFARGYAEAESAVVLASSDGPARGALRLKMA